MRSSSSRSEERERGFGALVVVDLDEREPVPASPAESEDVQTPTHDEALLAAARRSVGQLAGIGSALGFGALELIRIEATDEATFVAQRGRSVMVGADRGRAIRHTEAKVEAWLEERPRADEAPTNPRVPSQERAPMEGAPAAPAPPESTVSVEDAEESDARADLPAGPTRSSDETGQSAINGDITEFGILELLEFLRQTHRSGFLACCGPTHQAILHLQDGGLVSAVLVEKSIEVHLDALSLPPPDVSLELRRLGIVQILIEIVHWDEGNFRFAPSLTKSSPSTAQAFDTQRMLLEAFRRIDERDASNYS